MQAFVGFIKLLRPRQWVKNFFVLAPLLFSGLYTQHAEIVASAATFFIFCLASSTVYVFNDLNDLHRDRAHPIKSKSRPLASGIVSIVYAKLLFLILCLILALCLYDFQKILFPILLYLSLNFAYSCGLKNQPVIDIFCIALGFVLRVYAGSASISVPVSYWMLTTTLCLALYLAAVKRRQEKTQVGINSRKILSTYSAELLDRYAEMSATGALVFYSLFALTVKPAMAITIPFVLFGIFRYWYAVDILHQGESPTDTVLKDKLLLLTVLLWISISAIVVSSH